MSGSILYIHGFNSSPLSAKARQLQAVMQHLGLIDRLRLPALHHHPRQAIEQLEGCIAELDAPLLVGSSLGGYYATYLAERHGLKALLINPWTIAMPSGTTATARCVSRPVGTTVFKASPSACRPCWPSPVLPRRSTLHSIFLYFDFFAFTRLTTRPHGQSQR